MPLLNLFFKYYSQRTLIRRKTKAEVLSFILIHPSSWKKIKKSSSVWNVILNPVRCFPLWAFFICYYVKSSERDKISVLIGNLLLRSPKSKKESIFNELACLYVGGVCVKHISEIAGGSKLMYSSAAIIWSDKKHLDSNSLSKVTPLHNQFYSLLRLSQKWLKLFSLNFFCLPKCSSTTSVCNIFLW